ncbi:MAG: DUF3098 domain-containing protein [Alloprevotella sp.]|nr:DUF3098 domain-containing protein [Alloprevotella sp.]MBR1594957.1 DUF3098 domain-containing protein [Alloprevotella sp.]
MKDKKKAFAFGRINFILLGVGVAIVLLGMVLMSGSASDTTAFNPDIFSWQRIKLAPLVCLFGYLFMVVAILWRPKAEAETEEKK